MKISYYDGEGNKISSYFSHTLRDMKTIKDYHVKKEINSNIPRDYEIYSNFAYPTGFEKENMPQEIMVAVKAIQYQLTKKAAHTESPFSL